MPKIALNTGGNSQYDASEVYPMAPFVFPQIPGIAGAYIYTAGARFRGVNLIEGGVAPTQVGSIDWSAGYAAMNSNAHMISNIAETPAMVLMALAKRAAAANTPIIGNFKDATNQGVGLYSLGSQQTVTGIADRGTTAGLSVNLPAAPNAWAIYSVSIPEAGGLVVRDHTAGTEIVGTQTAPRVVETLGSIRIGSLDPTSIFGGTVHVAAANIATRVLTTVELDEVVEWYREAAALAGITA